MRFTKQLAVAALAAFTAAGCADLEVLNPNAADRDRALQTPGDIEALIGGSFSTWWDVSGGSNSSGPIMMTMAYQHSATAANFGMVEFSSYPKVPVHAEQADSYHFTLVGNNWTRIWRSVAVAVEGMKTLEEGLVELPADRLARARAYGFFMLGLSHASAAVMYDQGYIYDLDVEIADVSLHPHGDVLNAAFGYFDRAIQEASGQSFTIPATWMSREVSSAELVRLAHSYRARFRAAVARTPEERAAVNWQAVMADIDNGVTSTFAIDMSPGSGFDSGASVSTSTNIFRLGPWGQMSYQVLGMADQSGQFQRWFERDPWERHPNLSADQSGDPFLIITDDLRFAQGATIAEQEANRGTLYEISTTAGGFSAQWVRPDRGPFRWSYYRFWGRDDFSINATPRNRHDWPEVTVEEMRLLKAEALFRTGDLAGAADLVNETRVAAGLNATDASGTNTSCVPKLPDGQCGDLWEMLKWEVRLETIYQGLFTAPWYFHHRGWGDLTEGSFLQLPVAARDLELQLMPTYTFGPGHGSAAPVGTYGR